MYNIKLLSKYLANAYVFGFLILGFSNTNMICSSDTFVDTYFKMDEPPPTGF